MQAVLDNFPTKGRLLPLYGIGEGKTEVWVNLGNRAFVCREAKSL
jgi:hypothetical protein